MNLSLNFIRPEERRSASMVSIKFILQSLALLIPCILALLIAFTHISYSEKKSELELAKTTKIEIEKQMGTFAALSKELNDLQGPLKDLEGINKSRPSWSEVLLSIQEIVPASVQLKLMQIRHTIEGAPNDQIQRSISMMLGGRCEGFESERKVEEFRASFTEHPPLQDLIESAKISGFREDIEAGSGEFDRVFQIEVKFKPRFFK